MAAYHELEVYRAAFQLLVRLYRDMPRMPRDIHYTVLQKLRDVALSLLVRIYRANSLRDRREVLVEALADCMTVNALLRLLHELHYVGDGLYFNIAAAVEDVSRQLTGWQRYSCRKLMDERSASAK